MSVLYPGDSATASKPLGSIDEMWLAFDEISTNKTTAINAETHVTLPPLEGVSLHSHAWQDEVICDNTPRVLAGQFYNTRA